MPVILGTAALKLHIGALTKTEEMKDLQMHQLQDWPADCQPDSCKQR
jgi:hypothetical protein